MAKELEEKHMKILEFNTHLPRHKILENFDKFKKFIDKNGSLDLKNFTEFYQNMLPNKGNSEEFCKFIFHGKCFYFFIGMSMTQFIRFCIERYTNRVDSLFFLFFS